QSGPDLVVLDIGLPGGPSGLEVLKSIRRVNPAIRVIMVTGNTDPERARKALELGAIAYVDKPFDCDYLKRVVAMALRGGAKTTDSQFVPRRARPRRNSSASVRLPPAFSTEVPMRRIGLAVVLFISMALGPLAGEAQRAATIPIVGFLGWGRAPTPQEI